MGSKCRLSAFAIRKLLILKVPEDMKICLSHYIDRDMLYIKELFLKSKTTMEFEYMFKDLAVQEVEHKLRQIVNTALLKNTVTAPMS